MGHTLYLIYLGITLLGIPLLLFGIYYGWIRRREIYGAYFFMGLMVAGVLANFMFFGIGISRTYDTALFFGKARFLAVGMFPGLLLCFSWAYTGRRVPPYLLILVEIVPTLAMIALWTNDRHHLFYSAWTITFNDGIVREKVHHAAGYGVYLAHQYIVVMLAFGILLHQARQSQGVLKRQYLLVVVGAMSVFAFNLPSALGILSFTYPNMNQFGIFSIGIILITTVFRFKTVDVRPIAHGIVIENMEDGALVIDKLGRVVDFNTSIACMIDGASQDAVGKFTSDVFAGQPELAAWLAEAHPGLHEIQITCNQMPVIYELRDSLIRLNTGDIIGRVVIFRDVTEIRAAQARAHESALAHETAKIVSDFIASSSHDLRTPLTSITTSVYLLRRAIDSEARTRHLNIIEWQTRRLTRMIDQLHEFMELNQNPYLQAPTLILSELQQQVSTHLIDLARTKNMTLTWQLAADPLTITGNQMLILTAFEHLLHNALIYTPEEGSVTIRTMVQAKCAIVEVTDTGIGIAPEHHALIFDQFYKVNAARTSSESGSGLGLSIVKLIMDLHGGQVTFDSVPGQGSTFRLAFPLP